MLEESVRPQPAAVAVSAFAATAGKASSGEALIEQIAARSKPAMQALFARHRTYVFRSTERGFSRCVVSRESLPIPILGLDLVIGDRHLRRCRRAVGEQEAPNWTKKSRPPSRIRPMTQKSHCRKRIGANWCAEHCDYRPSTVRSSTWSITTRSPSAK
jgi:hypothetical protein